MRGHLVGASLLTQLVALALIWILSSVLFTLLGVATTTIIFPHLSGEITNMLQLGAIALDPAVLRYLQVFSATGMFVIPAGIFAYLAAAPNEDFLKLHKPFTANQGVLVFVLIGAIVPLVDGITTFFHQLPFPDFLEGFRAQLARSEAENLQLVNRMLGGNSLRDLAANLIVVAIMPAIGEELLFRGVIQPVFFKHFKNAWVAIALTSLLFAVMHQQFFNLGALFFISVLLGLIRHWTNNLWLCMLGHFINNGAFVMLAFFTETDPTDALTLNNTSLWILGSAIFTGGTLFLIYKTRNTAKVS